MCESATVEIGTVKNQAVPMLNQIVSTLNDIRILMLPLLAVMLLNTQHNRPLSSDVERTILKGQNFAGPVVVIYRIHLV